MLAVSTVQRAMTLAQKSHAPPNRPNIEKLARAIGLTVDELCGKTTLREDWGEAPGGTDPTLSPERKKYFAMLPKLAADWDVPIEVLKGEIPIPNADICRYPETHRVALEKLQTKQNERERGVRSPSSRAQRPRQLREVFERVDELRRNEERRCDEPMLSLPPSLVRGPKSAEEASGDASGPDGGLLPLNEEGRYDVGGVEIADLFNHWFPLPGLERATGFIRWVPDNEERRYVEPMLSLPPSPVRGPKSAEEASGDASGPDGGLLPLNEEGRYDVGGVEIADLFNHWFPPPALGRATGFIRWVPDNEERRYIEPMLSLPPSPVRGPKSAEEASGDASGPNGGLLPLNEEGRYNVGRVEIAELFDHWFSLPALGRATGFSRWVLGPPGAMAAAGILSAVVCSAVFLGPLERPVQMDFELTCLDFDGGGKESECRTVADAVVTWAKQDLSTMRAKLVNADFDGDTTIFMHSTNPSGLSATTWELIRTLRQAGVEIEWTPAPGLSAAERT